jgi:hypothetical protein
MQDTCLRVTNNINTREPQQPITNNATTTHINKRKIGEPRQKQSLIQPSHSPKQVQLSALISSLEDSLDIRFLQRSKHRENSTSCWSSAFRHQQPDATSFRLHSLRTSAPICKNKQTSCLFVSTWSLARTTDRRLMKSSTL